MDYLRSLLSGAHQVDSWGPQLEREASIDFSFPVRLQYGSTWHLFSSKRVEEKPVRQAMAFRSSVQGTLVVHSLSVLHFEVEITRERVLMSTNY